MRWFLLLFAVLLLAGCAGPALPAGPPLVAGSITRVDGDRVLIEERPGVQEGDKCVVRIDGTTQFFEQRGGSVQESTRQALSVGRRARAWASGPVLESYPCQAGAKAILLL